MPATTCPTASSHIGNGSTSRARREAWAIRRKVYRQASRRAENKRGRSGEPACRGCGGASRMAASTREVEMDKRVLAGIAAAAVAATAFGSARAASEQGVLEGRA